MRIAFICDEYPPKPHGGIGTFVEDFTRMLIDAGHEAFVLEVADKDGERVQDGVRIFSVGGAQRRQCQATRNRLRLRRRLVQLARELKLDVVEVPDFGGWLPWLVRGLPTVVRLHTTTGLITQQSGERIRRGTNFFERQTLRGNPYWIAPSDYIARETTNFYGFRPRLQALIPFAAEAQQVGAVPPAMVDKLSRYAVFVGYVGQRKGAFDLAHAARMFLPQFKDLHLVFVGRELTEGGTTAGDKIRQIVGPELSGRIIFTGPLPRAGALACIRDAAVFVLPSHMESFGMVYLEAMSVGTPIVATASSAIPEVVENNRTGLLVKPGDHVALAQQIAWILSDSQLAGQLVANAKSSLQKKFSSERCVRDSISFYMQAESMCRGPRLNFAAFNSA